MAINPRTKGAEGERQVYKMLNTIIYNVMVELGLPQEELNRAHNMVQRNQNQSAVGGNDLVNTFGLSIEVKRQETLAVTQWWIQTTKAAERNAELPVLMYRQNRKAWRIMTFGFLHVPTADKGWSNIRAIVEFNEEQFKAWFHRWVHGKLSQGHEAKI